ncbi:DUF5675 family protein [Methanobrevibacter sp.]|uniref:DUF5675 family protein n=1 Tax=Methanobrevibacter sp. TaxID=66852 RepID=UPI00386B9006
MDGTYVCDTLEDADRGLKDSMTLDEIRSKKIKDKTAIPQGNYKVTMNVISPRFSKKKYYKDFCGGRLPRITSVKGFDGVLIHIGNTDKDSSGCLIVGYNKEKGKVLNSKQAFEKLYKMLDNANRNGEKIDIKIYSTYKI